MLKTNRSLSFSHQRERALWIEAAKQAETRARRIAKSIADIRAKKSAGCD